MILLESISLSTFYIDVYVYIYISLSLSIYIYIGSMSFELARDVGSISCLTHEALVKRAREKESHDDCTALAEL